MATGPKPSQAKKGQQLNRDGTSGEEAGSELTRGVGKLILLPLDTVLETFCFAPRLLNARLHGLWGYVVRSLRVHCWRRSAAGGGREEKGDAAEMKKRWKRMSGLPQGVGEDGKNTRDADDELGFEGGTIGRKWFNELNQIEARMGWMEEGGRWSDWTGLDWTGLAGLH